MDHPPLPVGDRRVRRERKKVTGKKVTGKEFRLKLCHQLVNMEPTLKRGPSLFPASPRYASLRPRNRDGAVESPSAVAPFIGPRTAPFASVSSAATALSCTQWRGHYATLRSGCKLRCAYCSEMQATSHRTKYVCGVCIRPRAARARATYVPDLPLCIRPNNGASTSCFVLWHEAHLRHGPSRVAAVATPASPVVALEMGVGV